MERPVTGPDVMRPFSEQNTLHVNISQLDSVHVNAMGSKNTQLAAIQSTETTEDVLATLPRGMVRMVAHFIAPEVFIAALS